MGNHYAQLIAHGIAIDLHPTDDNKMIGNSGNAYIGFATDDLENAKSILKKHSIMTTERLKQGGQFLHFNDPDSTALYS